MSYNKEFYAVLKNGLGLGNSKFVNIELMNEEEVEKAQREWLIRNTVVEKFVMPDGLMILHRRKEIPWELCEIVEEYLRDDLWEYFIKMRYHCDKLKYSLLGFDEYYFEKMRDDEEEGEWDWDDRDDDSDVVGYGYCWWRSRREYWWDVWDRMRILIRNRPVYMNSIVGESRWVVEYFREVVVGCLMRLEWVDVEVFKIVFGWIPRVYLNLGIWRRYRERLNWFRKRNRENDEELMRKWIEVDEKLVEDDFDLERKVNFRRKYLRNVRIRKRRERK